MMLLLLPFSFIFVLRRLDVIFVVLVVNFLFWVKIISWIGGCRYKYIFIHSLYLFIIYICMCVCV